MKYETEEKFKQAEELLRPEFSYIDDIRDYNQEKVLRAFIENKVSPEHFYTVSGYGHDDMGKETLDKVFAEVFGAEKAIVRNHFVSGTHSIACALFGNLRHGDKLVSVTGTPYDTMLEVIGKVEGREDIRSESLMGHGVLYDEVALKPDGTVDFEGINSKIDESVTMIENQRLIE